MATSSTALQGSGPISFTHSTRGQLFVPLTAFSVSGTTVALTDIPSGSGWASEVTGNDATVLLQLAKVRLASGEAWPAPVLPAAAALVFTAAQVGTAGNNLVVAYGPASGAGGSVSLQVNQVWANLSDAEDAANALGVDDPGTSGYPAAVGPVAVVEASLPASPPTTPDLPVNVVLTFTTTSQDPQAVLDGSSNPLFELVPVAGALTASTPTLTVTVSVPSGGSTFSITVTYDPGNETVNLGDIGTGGDLSTVAPNIAALINVTAPSGGMTVPAAGTVGLSGGTVAAAASAVAYTS